MNFINTQNNITQTISSAIQFGIPNSGGLCIPEHFPQIKSSHFSADMSYSEFASATLQDFFSGDFLAPYLSQLCRNAFSFPLPLNKINDNTFILELFHGPTLSFKDFGAHFLAESLNIIAPPQLIILVATSGDTGSAVAGAFHGKNVSVIIFYPKGLISSRQEQQITCWGENVLALEVAGNFDDCQNLLKLALNDAELKNSRSLTTANSINIGRLLPQITYYAYASTKFYSINQIAPGFVIPAGNLGNATAAYWAKKMGFPIREIVIATNANQTLSNYLANGIYQPLPSVKTLANAMDVGSPNNFERLRYLFPTFTQFKNNVRAFSVSDNEIKNTIQMYYKLYNRVVCPHTATACFVREKLSSDPWIIIATADPTKFETVIEPLLHLSLAPSPTLQALLQRPTHKMTIENNFEQVKKIITGYF